MTGYWSPLYAESFSEFGTPLALPDCKGWILRREIAKAGNYDAMGCYPLFSCRDWKRLPTDVTNMSDELVSVSLVADPFGDFDTAVLGEFFDHFIHFKDHYTVNLSEVSITKHHRYYARRALQRVRITKSEVPCAFLDEWTGLYAELVERHRLNGIRAFSRNCFEMQLAVPGLVMFRATVDGVGVGTHLWYVMEDVAYSHLLALSPLGYELMAAYALYWAAIEFFVGKVRYLNLGAGAGVGGDDKDGLSVFKRGWANGARPAYFCGKILNRGKYRELLDGNARITSYFPAYRNGEF